MAGEMEVWSEGDAMDPIESASIAFAVAHDNANNEQLSCICLAPQNKYTPFIWHVVSSCTFFFSLLSFHFIYIVCHIRWKWYCYQANSFIDIIFLLLWKHSKSIYLLLLFVHV